MTVTSSGSWGFRPLLLVLVLVALVDDLGVDHVAVALGAALVGGGGRPGLGLAGTGLGLGVDRLGQLVARLLQRLGGRGDGHDGVVAGELSFRLVRADSTVERSSSEILSP